MKTLEQLQLAANFWSEKLNALTPEEKKSALADMITTEQMSLAQMRFNAMKAELESLTGSNRMSREEWVAYNRQPKSPSKNGSIV